MHNQIDAFMNAVWMSLRANVEVNKHVHYNIGKWNTTEPTRNVRLNENRVYMYVYIYIYIYIRH